MSVPYTGQIPIPNIAGSVDNMSKTILGFAGMQQRLRAQQVQAMRANNARNSQITKEIYGQGLEKVHESVRPYARQALENTAVVVQNLLPLPNGANLARQVMARTFDSLLRYNDEEQWHDAEEYALDMAEHGPKYQEAKKGMRYFRPTISVDEAATMSSTARGGAIQDMELKYNPDGSWSVIGTDVTKGMENATDIATHGWFNNAQLFNVPMAPVQGRSDKEIADAFQKNHRINVKNPAKLRGDALKQFTDLGMSTLALESLAPTNPIYEVKLNAMLFDQQRLMQEYNITDKEELFGLYELDPQNTSLFYTDTDGERQKTDLGQAIHNSITDEAKRLSSIMPGYVVDDEDSSDPQIQIDKALASGQLGRQVVPSVVMPGTEDQLPTTSTEQTMYFPLASLPSKVMDTVKINVANPDYAAFLAREGMTPEEAEEMRDVRALYVPPVRIDKQVSGIQFREEQVDYPEVRFLDERIDPIMLDLTDEGRDDPENQKHIGNFNGVFSKNNLTFQHFITEAQKQWRGEDGTDPDIVRFD